MFESKNPFSGVKTFFYVYFALLILILTFVGIMGWLGCEMIDSSMKFSHIRSTSTNFFPCLQTAHFFNLGGGF